MKWHVKPEVGRRSNCLYKTFSLYDGPLTPFQQHNGPYQQQVYIVVFYLMVTYAKGDVYVEVKVPVYKHLCTNMVDAQAW